jgi:hypothetical protein
MDWNSQQTWEIIGIENNKLQQNVTAANPEESKTII